MRQYLKKETKSHIFENWLWDIKSCLKETFFTKLQTLHEQSESMLRFTRLSASKPYFAFAFSCSWQPTRWPFLCDVLSLPFEFSWNVPQLTKCSVFFSLLEAFTYKDTLLRSASLIKGKDVTIFQLQNLPNRWPIADFSSNYWNFTSRGLHD